MARRKRAFDFVFTPPQNRGGVIFSLQFVCLSVCVSVCLSVRLCLCVFHVCNQGEITSLLQRSKGCSKLAGVSYDSGYWHTAIVNGLVVSVKFNESVPSGDWSGPGFCVFFWMTGTAHGAENMEIVTHGHSNPKLKPATFQSQVQRSAEWATGEEKWTVIYAKEKL